MTEQAAAAKLLLTQPAQIGRWCGFDRLQDNLHGDWIRKMVSMPRDMTLLAHRGSCKTTCVTLALATLMLTAPERNLLFLRKTDRDVA